MLKIKKDSSIFCVIEKDYTVSLVEEIPENRVCFECRTLTNLEVTEFALKTSKYNIEKVVKKFNELDVENTSVEDVAKLESDILNYSIGLKNLSKEYFPKFLKKIHNCPENFELNQLHINYIDALMTKVFYESMEISEDDALFFG